MIIVGIQWEMWWVPYKERYVKCGQQWARIVPKNSCIYSSLTTWSHYTVHIYLYQTFKLFKVETKYCKKKNKVSGRVVKTNRIKTNFTKNNEFPDLTHVFYFPLVFIDFLHYPQNSSCIVWRNNNNLDFRSIHILQSYF